MSTFNTRNDCYCRGLASILLLLLLAVLAEHATYTNAAPSITRNELTVLPRSVADLVDSDAFERIWRKAATDQIVEKFGGGGSGRGAALPTRNMVGDTMGSEDFHQKVCNGSGQGMSSMGGMMSGQSAPVSYMGTFIGSEKFQSGSCDMMSQGMTQFGSGMNSAFRSTAAATADSDDVQDPVLAIDEFFRSPYYENARKQLRDMFSDVRF